MPNHYLNQCWNIINWNLRNKLQWNFNRNSYNFIHENAFENVVWKMAAICVGLNVLNAVAFKSTASPPRDVIPLLTHWSYASFALIYRYRISHQDPGPQDRWRLIFSSTSWLSGTKLMVVFQHHQEFNITMLYVLLRIQIHRNLPTGLIII